jgi:multidrug efflux pump subunit AcrA (membrane-fusion protein)
MNKKLLYGSIGLIVLVALVIIVQRINPEESGSDVTFVAKKGDFRIEVVTTGELEAKNSVKVLGPTGLQQVQIWEVKVDNMVDEGTVVKKGEFIARLDQSQLGSKIQTAQNDLQMALSQELQTKLDTALELRKSRDDMINLEYAVQEKEIVVEQSQFEPPAAIRNAEIQLDKARRSLIQAKENYSLKVEKAQAQAEEKKAIVNEERSTLDFLTQLSTKFTIIAPEDGMVIYKRNWRGEKQGIGSSISSWDPTVATLPDLSSMASKVYINEENISGVKEGQQVEITLDAFPEKQLTGTVVQVANVGEQKPNSDAKVFEALVQINESDTTLRPGMTTGNTIIANIITEVIFIPIESIHNSGDSVLYVIKRSGLGTRRQEVLAGKSDSDFTVILEGVEEGDVIYLSDPKEDQDVKIDYLISAEDLASRKN